MSPRIIWVNHASFIYDDGDIRLICDPWLEGRTFYNGWDLLAPTAMTFEQFETITHIWISHEHPDHLSPPNLSRIPPEVRARITMLYQATSIRRVLKYLESLGFRKIVELQPAWARISPKTEVLCGPCQNSTAQDSYLAFRTDEITTLNLNDCVPSGRSDAAAIKKLVGTPDVLLAQFSFACWTGNRNQAEKHVIAAEKAKSNFLHNMRDFAAPYVIPAASFSWFCNAENFWMNQAAHRVDAITGEIESTGFTPIVLYPGDEWTLRARHDNGPALERYRTCYERIEKPEILFKNPRIEIETLNTHALTFAKKLMAANQTLLLALLRPATIFLDDHGAAFRFSLKGGLHKITCARELCDVALGSDSLDYAFRYLWGGDTLNINGRFEKPLQGKFSRFRIYFAIAALNNGNEHFDFSYLTRNALVVISKFFEYRRGNDSLEPTI